MLFLTHISSRLLSRRRRLGDLGARRRFNVDKHFEIESLLIKVCVKGLLRHMPDATFLLQSYEYDYEINLAGFLT